MMGVQRVCWDPIARISGWLRRCSKVGKRILNNVSGCLSRLTNGKRVC